jgi:hypothetical protein
MSRYYKIVISDPKTNEILVPNTPGVKGFARFPYSSGKSTWTSLIDGANVNTIGGTNRAAPRLVLDLPTSVMHQPDQSSGYLSIETVSIDLINQANNLNVIKSPLNIAVFGGMAAGLPLANPAQSGPLITGQIQRCFGNWTGTQMSISIFVMTGGSSVSSNQTTGNPGTVPAPSTVNAPANIVFVWEQGQKLIDAIVIALRVPFPNYSIQGNIHEDLTWTSGQAVKGVYNSLHQFAAFIHQKSLSVIGGYAPDPELYQGVNIAISGNTISIFDGSTPLTPKQLVITDLLGQPTWNEGRDVQVAVVLRGDIEIGDYVTLPLTSGVTSGSAPSNVPLPSTSLISAPGAQFSTGPLTPPEKDSSIFQGTYRISSIRHVGDSRDANGLAWTSVLDLQWIPPVATNAAPTTATANSLPVIYTGTSPTGYYLPS